MPRPAASYHVPALAAQVVALLRPHGSGTWVDGMIGAAGHARLICDRLSNEATFLGLDRDPAAIEAAAKALQGVKCRVVLRRAHFESIGALADDLGGKLAGAFVDVGVSSDQLDRGQGFSIDDTDARLDLRQDPGQELTAAVLVNELPEKSLADLIFANSDERLSRRIAASVVKERPLSTMGDLVRAVTRSLPRGYRHRDATLRRVVMALRVAVGRDIEQLETGLNAVIERLLPEARVAVISWQSKEDGLVKRLFRREKIAGRMAVLTPKPLRPSAEEVRENPRARAARLRAAEKLAAVN